MKINEKFYKWTLTFFFLIAANLVFAQSQIKGRVTDESGAPLSGVTVTEKGTTNATSTDDGGAFTLTVSSNSAILVFNYIGKQLKEIPVGNQTTINTSLVGDDNKVDEVVVIGYGTQSRETLTTSISKLDKKVLENVPFANVASALQGTLPGVRVQSTSGQPGAAPRVIVRGGTSINNPNGATPLYIVDGILRSDINNINSNDIESLQVLKDAAS